MLPLDVDDDGSIEDMARTAPNTGLIEGYLSKLKNAGLERTEFEAVMVALSTDKQLRAADVVGIASGFDRGRRLKTKAEAIAALRKRFTELRQIATLTANAEKTRPW